MEESTHIRAYGTARGGNRGFKSHAAAKSNGERRGHQRSIHIARGQLPFVARDGQEHAGYAVPDVALDDESDEEYGEQDAHEWSDKGEYVASADGVGVAKSHHHLARKMHDSLEQHRCQTTKDTYHDAQQQHVRMLGDVSQAPNM